MAARKISLQVKTANKKIIVINKTNLVISFYPIHTNYSGCACISFQSIHVEARMHIFQIYAKCSSEQVMIMIKRETSG